MQTNVNYTIVGAFVIILVAAITMSVIWLSSGFSFEQYSTYAIYMDESISGLSINATVEYNGVSVGSVKDIQLTKKNPRLVVLLVSISDEAPVTRGTVASISTRGLTGLVYIALKDNGNDLRPIVRSPGQEYPVIPTAPSIFVRLDTALTQVSSSLRDVTTSINKLLDPENQKAIKLTLSNLAKFSDTLVANNQKFDTILTNTADASKKFGALLNTSQNTIRLFETQTLPATYQAISNLDNVIKTLSDTALIIKQNPSILIRGGQPQPLGPGEGR